MSLQPPLSEVFSGPTEDEAIQAGLDTLGLTKDQVEIEVLSQEGETPVEVRLSVSEGSDGVERTSTAGSGSETRGGGEEPAPEQILEYAQEDAIDFLEGLLESMGLEGDVSVRPIEDGVEAEVNGPDMGKLIGRHGRGLEAIQELLRAAIQHQAGTRVRVNLDIEGYRVRRREAVADLARHSAERATSEGQVALEPMPAFERKVVHDVVGEIEGLTSSSEGEDPNRYVVIRAVSRETETAEPSEIDSASSEGDLATDPVSRET